MNIQPTLVSIISGAIAVFGVIITSIFQFFNQKNQKKADEALAAYKAEAGIELAKLNSRLVSDRDAEIADREAAEVFAKFKNPLMHSAYDLQSRIYNITELHFLGRYLLNGCQFEQDYALENTVFLVAQFLGWTEIIRQEVQFLALEDDDQTRELRLRQDEIYTQLQTDAFGEGFRLFAGEQRAVGELMIDSTTAGPRCIGFATFQTGRNPAIDRWLDRLRHDLKLMASDPGPFQDRLIAFQHSLIDLLQFLDPNHIWFPASKRRKISAHCKPKR